MCTSSTCACMHVGLAYAHCLQLLLEPRVLVISTAQRWSERGAQLIQNLSKARCLLLQLTVRGGHFVLAARPLALASAWSMRPPQSEAHRGIRGPVLARGPVCIVLAAVDAAESRRFARWKVCELQGVACSIGHGWSGHGTWSTGALTGPERPMSGRGAVGLQHGLVRLQAKVEAEVL